MMKSEILIVLATFYCLNSAQIAEYRQCGGISYKGPTSCASGLKCVKYNEEYSYCIKKCPSGWNPQYPCKIDENDAIVECKSTTRKLLSGLWRNEYSLELNLTATCDQETSEKFEKGQLHGGFIMIEDNGAQIIKSFTGLWSSTDDGAMISFLVGYIYVNDKALSQLLTAFNGKWYKKQNELHLTWIMSSNKQYEDRWSSITLNKNIFNKIN